MALGILLALHLLLLTVQAVNLVYVRRSGTRAKHRERFISIIVPARNEAFNLGRLIPSLLRQDYPRFEMLIYDDASDDHSWEVIQAHSSDSRLRGIRGKGPPSGWVGKVYALFQTVPEANGDVYLFLDADAELVDPNALTRLAARFDELGSDHVLTGFTRLLGGGLLLVSLVPYTILTLMPWPLGHVVRSRHLAALNGQCWMIDAATYHRLQPHERVAAEVLEDVEIGRYLKSNGIMPTLVDVQFEVAIHMYTNWSDAWRGFQKNAYLLMGGTPITFVLSASFFAGVFVVAPLLHPELLFTLYMLKLVTDRASRMPLWITLLAPVSFGAGVALQLNSAVRYWTGKVQWKGRIVSPR